MKVVVVGTGYVGLVQGVCLAELGNSVVCVDTDEEKIERLKKGISPIYEPGIEELLQRNLKAKRVSFTTSLKGCLKGSDVVFITVGTPSDEDGRADLKYVLKCAEDIGKNLQEYSIIVNKSTVPIGTGEMVKKTIARYYDGDFSVISNPEFLREGSAIEDWMKPDRVIIGYSDDKEAAENLGNLYSALGSPTLITNIVTAEMIKYASNSLLATEISFINSISRICEKVGADVTEVAEGMKLDKRIGANAFLTAGLGYGGSCFPKDVSALIKIARDNGAEFKILEEVEAVNLSQRQRIIQKLKKELGNLKGKKIGLWGIAFKPETDDIRMAPAITIIEALEDLGAQVYAFDAVAGENVQKIFPELVLEESAIDVCEGADALLIVTEWDEFKEINLNEIKSKMKSPIILDGRNIFSPEKMRDYGFIYHSVGRPLNQKGTKCKKQQAYL